MESANDQPNAVDDIGFRPYVSALAAFLLAKQTKPPITVSLEGEWGTGKSSFMAQLERALRVQAQVQADRAFARDQEKPRQAEKIDEVYQSPQQTKAGMKKLRKGAPKVAKPDPLSIAPDAGIEIVRFNAWRHDKDEALWASFALEFARKLAPKKWRRALWFRGRLAWARSEQVDKAVALIRLGVLILVGAILVIAVIKPLFFPKLGSDTQSEFAAWWEYLKRWTPPILATPTIIALLWLMNRLRFSPLELEVVKNLKGPNYDAKVSFLERFQDDFEHFLRVYVGGRRIFVLIDDLDRCEVPKAAELLQAITLMLPPTAPVFLVVALDRKKVAMGVAVRSKELLPFLASDEKERAAAGLRYGNAFVEKFIQIQLRIPQLSPNSLGRYLKSLLTPKSATAGGLALDETPADPASSDPEVARAIMEMAAETLGYNPRRLKQFLNLWRLRFYVASFTKQLTLVAPRMHPLLNQPDKQDGWSLPQLGKVVLLEMRWPEILDRAIKAPHELVYWPEEWKSDSGLLRLLGHVPTIDGRLPDDDTRATFFLHGVAHLVPSLYGAASAEKGSN